jgi:hypothetical protein
MDGTFAREVQPCAASHGTKRKAVVLDTWVRNRRAFVRLMVGTQRSLARHFLLDRSISRARREVLARHRTEAVELIAAICERFGLQPLTAGLALRYFDLCFGSRGFLPPSVYPLIALACVLVAAKMWDQYIPTLVQLLVQADLPNEFTLNDIRMSELDLLQQLNWRVLLVSPHSFLEVFNSVLGLESDPNFDAKRATFIIDMSCYVCDALAYSEPIIAAAAALCSWPCDERAQAMVKFLGPLADWCHALPSEILCCKEILLLHYLKEFCRTPADQFAEPDIDSRALQKDRPESPDSILAMNIAASAQNSVEASPDLPAFGTSKCAAVPGVCSAATTSALAA